MMKSLAIAAVVAISVAAGAMLSRTYAADEIRCRVNVEAFLKELNEVTAASDKAFLDKLRKKP